MDERDTSRDALIFAMPFLQAAGLKNVEHATAFALMCWNLALLPEDRRQTAIKELMALFTFAASWFPDSKNGFAAVQLWMDRLIKRKMEKYAHRQRVIVQHEVSIKGETVTLTTGTMAVDGEIWRLN